MLVAIASGKGGTGKTTVAVNLAVTVADEGLSVELLDCDVEAPNTHLFLPPAPPVTEPVTVPVPKVHVEKCNGCGECSQVCQFGAIVTLGGKATVFSELCHGCDGCIRLCPENALTTENHPIGIVSEFETKGLRLLQGKLTVGQPLAVPVIQAVRKKAHGRDLTLIDASPGASCAFIEAIRDTDLVILVTEPTPFGLHDLRKAVEGARLLHRPLAVVINRLGLGDARVKEYCTQNGIEILMEIPNERGIAEIYAQGNLLVEALPVYRARFLTLWHRILKMAERRFAS